MDDGFWEGELNGRIGVFPSLVVELVHAEGEEEEEVRLYSLYVNPDFSTYGCYKYHVTLKALFICFLIESVAPLIFIFSPASPHPHHASLLSPHPDPLRP